MDSLRRRVLAFDRQRNTPRQLDVTTRGTETRRICLDCRRSPDTAMVQWTGELCPFCVGLLIEVVW